MTRIERKLVHRWTEIIIIIIIIKKISTIGLHTRHSIRKKQNKTKNKDAFIPF